MSHEPMKERCEHKADVMSLSAYTRHKNPVSLSTEQATEQLSSVDLTTTSQFTPASLHTGDYKVAPFTGEMWDRN